MADFGEKRARPIADLHAFLKSLRNGGAAPGDNRNGEVPETRRSALGGFRTSRQENEKSGQAEAFHSPVFPFWSTLLLGVDRRRRDGGQQTRGASEARLAYLLIALSFLLDIVIWSYSAFLFTGGTEGDLRSWSVAIAFGAIFAIAFAAFEVSFYRTELRGTFSARGKSSPIASADALTELLRARPLLLLSAALIVFGVVFLIWNGTIPPTAAAAIAIATGWLAFQQQFGGRELLLIGGRVGVILAAAVVTSLPVHMSLYSRDIDDRLWAEARMDGGPLALQLTQAEARVSSQEARLTAFPQSDEQLVAAAQAYCPASVKCDALSADKRDYERCASLADQLAGVERIGVKEAEVGDVPKICVTLASTTFSGRRGEDQDFLSLAAQRDRFQKMTIGAEESLTALGCGGETQKCVEDRKAELTKGKGTVAQSLDQAKAQAETLRACRSYSTLADLRADPDPAKRQCEPLTNGFARRYGALRKVVTDAKDDLTQLIAFVVALALPLTVIFNKLTASEAVRSSLAIPVPESARWIVGRSRDQLRITILDPTEVSSRRRSAIAYLDMTEGFGAHEIEWLIHVVEDEECRRMLSRLREVEVPWGNAADVEANGSDAEPRYSEAATS